MHPSMYDHAAIQKELREQKRKANLNPLVPELAPRVWVAYAWNAVKRTWILQGFIRMQRVTQRRVNRWRKKMKIAAGIVIRWIELFTAARCGIDTKEPHRPHPSLRPDVVPSDKQAKARRAKARRDARRLAVAS